MHHLDELLEHLLGDGEVGDHAVLHRADGLDVAGHLAEHGLGLGPTAWIVFLPLRAAFVADGDHRDGSSRTMPFAAHVDQRVGGAEVDGEVGGEVAAQGKRTWEWLRVESAAIEGVDCGAAPAGRTGERWFLGAPAGAAEMQQAALQAITGITRWSGIARRATGVNDRGSPESFHARDGGIERRRREPDRPSRAPRTLEPPKQAAMRAQLNRASSPSSADERGRHARRRAADAAVGGARGRLRLRDDVVTESDQRRPTSAARRWSKTGCSSCPG